jgi:Transposase
VICLDARHARAALRMQLNKTDRNDAEGLAQIMRTGWFRAVHVKSFDAHRARALLGARLQLVGMVTRLSNHIRGVLKTFGMLPGSVRGRPFAERVEILIAERPDVAPIVRPMLAAWRTCARDRMMRRPMPTAERTMTPGASDQGKQRDDLTAEMRLENGSELARKIITSQVWSVQPCVRPLSAVHITAGHNALRGSGPGQQHAFENAMAQVGCPDRRIDRPSITCCSPSQP